jgi:membrane protease YdiL (CAAX protease family)
MEGPLSKIPADKNNSEGVSAITSLTRYANEVIAGSYGNVVRIFDLTNPDKHSPEVAELAEAFGMMLVKIEAREFKLEETIAELRHNQEELAKAHRTRVQLTSIFISVVMLISVYTFILGLCSYKPGLSIYIKALGNPIIEIAALLLIMRMITKSGLSRQSFGLTCHNWKQSIGESLAVSTIIIGVLMAVKYAVTVYHPDVFKEHRLVEWSYFNFSYIAYLVVAPLQEFLTRGTVQSTLQRLFVGRHNNLLAILVTSFLFGALHVFSSINLAVAALLSGFLWGWLYSRQQNLIGVSVSHFLIGNMVGLMGYWTFF